MTSRKKLSKHQQKELKRRMKEINAAGEDGRGFFHACAELRVKQHQKEEWSNRCEAEYPLVLRDAKRCLLAQMGLDVDSRSASDSASAG
jgi:hypothetical protein